MLLATPEDMRAAYGPEEITSLTRAHLDALAESDETRTEEDVLTFALLRASSRAASYLAARYPALAGESLPEGTIIPPSLVNAVCDIARYLLTGGAVQEADPIAGRYKDALAWLKEIASGVASLTEFEPDAPDSDLITADVAFSSRSRQWGAG